MPNEKRNSPITLTIISSKCATITRISYVLDSKTGYPIKDLRKEKLLKTVKADKKTFRK
jgi:hypothetical protein